MHRLRSEQVNAWRLSRHHLLEPLDSQQWLSVVQAVGGIQAQVLSAAELALWARAQVLPSDVQAALWRDRALVKTWAMRGTLHLLQARDLPLYVAARRALPARRPPSWFSYHGVTPEELELIIEGVGVLLHESPMTREQLADAIAERLHNPKLKELLLSGWGTLLKPSAFKGNLCFGPNQGQLVTFVRPSQWLGTWQTFEPEQALKEIARRYFTSYGPATSDDFARWWGIDSSAAKRFFRSLTDEVTAVEVDAGWQGWALHAMVQQMQGLEAACSVRLLPSFDPYTIALYRHPFVLDERFKARVSRPQGWISAVVLVDGRIAGTWEHEKQQAGIVVKIDLFDAPTPEVKRGIEAEAHRLGDFFGAEVTLVYIT